MGDVLYHEGYQPDQISQNSTRLYENFILWVPAQMALIDCNQDFMRMISLLKYSRILTYTTLHQTLY